MAGKPEKEGKYELFESNHGNIILNLNDKNYFAIIRGNYGEILVKSDSDHVKEKTLKKGNFYLANFESDPAFKDMPHLFLEEKDNLYKEWILPNDRPTKADYQKKLIKTQHLISKEKMLSHIKKKK